MRIPYIIRDPAEAARIILSSKELDLGSGQLFAVPVPVEDAMDAQKLNKVIDDSLIAARERGITGKEITPFLLSQVADATKGRSLKTSILFSSALL